MAKNIEALINDAKALRQNIVEANEQITGGSPHLINAAGAAATVIRNLTGEQGKPKAAPAASAPAPEVAAKK